MGEVAVDKDALRAQLEFARHNFVNLQELIRFTDTKAGVIIALMTFLASSGLFAVKMAVQQLSLHGVHAFFSFLMAFAALGFVICAVATAHSVVLVIKPRYTHAPDEIRVGRDLLWQAHVLEHGSPSAYHEALRSAPLELLLENYARQVFELARISRLKMQNFERSRKALILSFIFWILTISAVLPLSA